jgi:hypothetical protein
MKQNIQKDIDKLPKIAPKQLMLNFIIKYSFVWLVVIVLWGVSLLANFLEGGPELSKIFNIARNILTVVVLFFTIKKLLWIHKITNLLGQTIIYDKDDNYTVLDRSEKV